MKAEGKGSLTLFNVQSETERLIRDAAAIRLMGKLGMEVPKDRKMVQNFEMPLIPKQEDYYLFPFRHLSATTVGGGTWKATDFSKGNILKKSTPLLAGKPAYLNHVQAVGKAVGVVGETEWVAQYKNQNGDIIPGGIEAPFVIDSVLHPELVRQMSAPVSPVHSASVTVVFAWEASHDFEHDGDFYWHIGEMVDDEMVRRIVTEIVAYDESSLVWMGADPYAKSLNDKGEVVNIDRAAAFAKHKLSDDPDKATWSPTKRYYLFDCLDSEKLLHLNKSSIDYQKPKPENDYTMNEELLQFLAAFFATTPEKIKKGEFTKADAEKVVTVEALATLRTNSENFTKVSAEKATLDTKVVELEKTVGTLKAEVESAKPKISLADDVMKRSKEEAKRVYGIFAGGKPEKTIEDEIESEVSLEKLEAKIKMFGGKVVTEFGASCTKCGSKEVSFRSSAGEGEDPNKKEPQKVNLVETSYR